MAYLRAEDLKPGMILKNDFINERERLFLAEGTALTDHLINRILELEVPYVSIEQDSDERDSDKRKTPSVYRTNYERKTDEFLKAYNDSNKVIKELFESAQSGRRLNLDGIRETIGVFIELLHDDENIVPKLQKIHMSDEYTFYHSINVCIISMLIGKWMKMSVRELRKLGYTGAFHDIGKCRVPPDILNKPEGLNDKEWNVMRQHPIHGYNILKKNNIISNDVLMGTLMHHEREDGSGYPLGLQGRNIHYYGKIIAIADIFDAMMSDRVYRKKRPPFKVTEYIADRSFDCLDPLISWTFLQRLSMFYVGNSVRLNDGRIGKIIYIYPQQPTKPVVFTEGEYLDFSEKIDVTIIEILG